MDVRCPLARHVWFSARNRPSVTTEPRKTRNDVEWVNYLKLKHVLSCKFLEHHSRHWSPTVQNVGEHCGLDLHLLSALCTTKSLCILRLGNWLCEERRVGDLVQPLHSSASLSPIPFAANDFPSKSCSLARSWYTEWVQFQVKIRMQNATEFPSHWAPRLDEKMHFLASCPLKCCILTFLAVSSCRVVTSCSSRTVCMYHATHIPIPMKNSAGERKWSGKDHICPVLPYRLIK